MYRPVSRVVGRAEQTVEDGDHRVEVRARHGAEHEDQPDERTGGRRRVLQQLQADVAGRQPARHDARPDHGHDQHRGAESLGHEAAGEVETKLTDTGLDLDAELEVAAVQLVGHDASGNATNVRIRSRSSASAASNAALVPAGTGSGIDQCSQLSSGSSSSCARSHTVTTSGGSTPTSSRFCGAADDRSSPARRAAASAPGWTRFAGWVPADSSGFAGGLAPQRGGQLRTCGVRGAHEQRAPGRKSSGSARGRRARRATGARSDADRPRSIATARSTRPARAHRGDGRAGSTPCRADGAARAALDPTPRARRRSPSGPDHRARRDAPHASARS